MTESEFISANKDQWEELERVLLRKTKDPDQLEELFVKVSSDLSYARTFYPNRTVRVYLNGLTQRVLNLIQTKRNSFRWSSIVHFYKRILPEQLWRSRFAILVAFLVFVLAVFIGALSTAYNLEFTRVILGDAYVEMTNKNINDGDPMAVYKQMGQVDMFWAITLNNIRVAFLAFVMGLFGTVGTIVILLYNGIMVGTFQYFFYKKGLFLTSFLTIWIHGTIEISSIILAGAAGIVLGDGLLHPKTYERSTSLQVASKRAIRILLSTVPLFIIAGFLESFVTRLTDMSETIKILIIVISGIFILTHYVIYPYLFSRKNAISDSDFEVDPEAIDRKKLNNDSYLSIGGVIENTLASFRMKSGSVFYRGILPVLILITFSYWGFAKYHEILQTAIDYDYLNYLLFNFQRGSYALLAVYWLSLTHLMLIVMMSYHDISYSWENYLFHVKYSAWKIGLLLLPHISIFYFAPDWMIVLFFILLPPHLIMIICSLIITEEQSFIKNIKSGIANAYNYFAHYLVPYLVVSGIYGLLYLLLITLASFLYTDFISWHQLFPGPYGDMIYINSLMRIIIGALALTLYYTIFVNQYKSVRYQLTSDDLFQRIENFGVKRS